MHIKAMYVPGIGTHVVIVRQRDSNKTSFFPSIFFQESKQGNSVHCMQYIYTHTAILPVHCVCCHGLHISCGATYWE